MLSVCPYFHVHQPLRVKKYRIFDVGQDHDYFNDRGETDLNNYKVLKKVSEKSYLPTNAILEDLLREHPNFKFAFSFSGVLLEQLEEDFPEVLDSFKRLVSTGRVELLADTYHHSLAFFHSKPEFKRQVREHEEILYRIFGQRPRVFRNTELSYNNELAQWIEENGYKGILAEGWDPILEWRSPNFVYRPKGCTKAKVLLKNYRLSDDIAFRFGEQSWAGWPLDAGKFAYWVNSHHGNGSTVNLFMDYETFGEHQWDHTGIFDFLRAFPGEILKNSENTFMTPSEAMDTYEAVGEIDVPHILTWADTERDLTAWMGNDIQKAAIGEIYKMEEDVLNTHDKTIISDWRKLQTSDHFYYMCTKWFADGDVHAYFNPYESPYDAYIAFMNALNDLQLRVQENLAEKHSIIRMVKNIWGRFINRFKFAT